jgi:hypothetical protein
VTSPRSGGGSQSYALTKALRAIDKDNIAEARTVLANAEWRAFNADSSDAGEIAYARWRLEQGDCASAAAILLRLQRQ